MDDPTGAIERGFRIAILIVLLIVLPATCVNIEGINRHLTKIAYNPECRK